METPFIRAKARDTVDALDNLTAYQDPDIREETVEFVRSVLGDLQEVIARAVQTGTDPNAACQSFIEKFNEYWNQAPP